MLLYKDPFNRYLAIHPALRFVADGGFSLCNEGRAVPRNICELFIRRWGGQIIDADEEIVLQDV